MRAGIISDTHDNILMIKKAIELFNREKVDIVLHGGDHVAPFTCIVWKELNCDILAVFGNNDGDLKLLKKKFRKIGQIYDRPREIILVRKKILLMHEPDNLNEYARSGKYDLVIFGHTHFKKNYYEGKTLVLNPGEGCGWITGKSTAMILDLNTFNVEEFELGVSPLAPLTSKKMDPAA